MKLQLLVGSWDIDLQVKYNKLYNYTKIMIIAIRFTGYAFVSQDNTWTGGFVALMIIPGTLGSLVNLNKMVSETIVSAGYLRSITGKHVMHFCLYSDDVL